MTGTLKPSQSILKVNFKFKLDKNITLDNYYKNVHNVSINANQPLFLVQQRGGSNENRRYIPPELCVMLGLTDDMVQDTSLMKSISQFTKLTPDDKVHSIDDILKLLNEKQGKVRKDKISENIIESQSSLEKMLQYGIEIVNTNETFKGYSMTYPQISASNNSKF